MDQIVNFNRRLEMSLYDLYPVGSFVLPSMIEEDVTEFVKIDLGKILSPSRRREHVRARRLLIYALHRYTDLPLKDIGKRMGNRDHTTIMHSLQSSKTYLDIRDELYYPIFKTYFTYRDTKYMRIHRGVTNHYQFNF